MLWNKIMALAFADASESPDKTLVSLASDSSDEYISELEAAVKSAGERAGYTLTVLDSKNGVSLQLAQVEGARGRGEPGIIVNLVDPHTADDILRAAGDMKVVFINRAPTDSGLLSENAVYVGSDERLAGTLQGDWLVKHFREMGQTEIRYLLLKGPPNLPSSAQRTDAALQALAAGGIRAIEAAPPIVANYDRNEAMVKLLPLLRSGVEFDVILSNNDAMALGAIQALEYLKMDPASTTIVGIDATKPAIQALKEGKLAMTAFQDAMAQATVSIAALANMLEGAPIGTGTQYPVSKDNPYVILIPFELVTRYHIPQNLYYPAMAAGRSPADHLKKL